MGVKRLRLVVTVYLIIALTGCVTFEKFNLVPKGGKIIWLNGNQIVRVNEEDFYVNISYRGAAKNMLSFNVKIANKHNESMLISPELFFLKCKADISEKPEIEPKTSYEGLDEQPKDTIQVNYSEPTIENELTISSITAEENLKKLEDKAISRTQRSQALVGGAALCCLLGSLLTIFSDNERDGESKSERRRRKAKAVGEITEFSSDVATDEMDDYKRDMERIDREYNFWSKSVMRKTTLEGGESVNSLVMFPITKELRKASVIEICLPINGIIVTAEFEMQIFKYE